jgi:hypothetical protein
MKTSSAQTLVKAVPRETLTSGALEMINVAWLSLTFHAVRCSGARDGVSTRRG